MLFPAFPARLCATVQDLGQGFQAGKRFLFSGAVEKLHLSHDLRAVRGVDPVDTDYKTFQGCVSSHGRERIRRLPTDGLQIPIISKKIQWDTKKTYFMRLFNMLP